MRKHDYNKLPQVLFSCNSSKRFISFSGIYYKSYYYISCYHLYKVS
jgi:hypothetical protein